MNNFKPIFGIDVTENKNNETVNGSEFIVRKLSEQKINEYDDKHNDVLETVEKSQSPLWIEIVKWLCLIIFLPVVMSIIKVGFVTATQNAPILVIVGFVCGIAWVALMIYTKKKEKKVLQEEKVEERVDELVKDREAMYRELGVPEDAEYVDVLQFFYKIKKEKIVPYASGLQLTAYVNPEVKIFATEEDLYIADHESVYSLKKSEFKSITCVDKRVYVPMWNKDEEPTKGRFKPYKMTVNSYGCVIFKPYYILNIEHEGKIYGLYFPCYELEVFERLTGLKAEVRTK